MAGGGHGRSSSWSVALMFGAFDYLVKPIDFDYLVQSLESALAMKGLEA